ncbi:hypothetical protein EAD96_24475 [Micromonospora sp. BL1]|nr:hypothetical protein EAD96_24475 [Micromonospora sp. BL1]
MPPPPTTQPSGGPRPQVRPRALLAIAVVLVGIAVRVVNGSAEFGRVQPGDVLACRTTDPAWTPLLGVAAAIVTEIDGLLSHAAIVARCVTVRRWRWTGALRGSCSSILGREVVDRTGDVPGSVHRSSWTWCAAIRSLMATRCGSSVSSSRSRASRPRLRALSWWPTARRASASTARARAWRSGSPSSSPTTRARVASANASRCRPRRR